MTDASEAAATAADAVKNIEDGAKGAEPTPAPEADPAPAPAPDPEAEEAKGFEEFYSEAFDGVDPDDADAPSSEPEPESDEDSDKESGEEGDAASKPEGDEDKPAEEPAKSDESSDGKAKAPEGEETKPAPETKPAEPEKPSEGAAEEQPKQLTPEEYNRYFNEVRDAAIEELEKNHYTFDAETVERFQEEPEKVLANLAARLHFDVTAHVLTQVQRQLGPAFESFMQAREAHTESASRFFEAWPQLKDQDQGVLTRIGKAYRDNNPQAPEDQFIREVGAAAMLALRVPFDAPGNQEQPAQPNGNGAQAPAPASAAAPNPQEPSRPFVPAGGAPPAPSSAPDAGKSTFEALDQELFEEAADLD